jgi:hypothetical protein
MGWWVEITRREEEKGKECRKRRERGNRGEREEKLDGEERKEKREKNREEKDNCYEKGRTGIERKKVKMERI